MKKVVLLASMVALLIFSSVTSAFASTAYFDYMLNGNNKTEFAGTSTTVDRDNYLLGVEVPLEQFLIGFEYSKDTVKNTGGDSDTTVYMVRAGYGLILNDIFQLYGDLSYTNFDMDTGKYSPIAVGFDAKYALNERMFISGRFDYAVSGKYDDDTQGKMDTDYMAAKVKYNFLLTERLGVAAGYDWTNITMKPALGDMKVTQTGFTFGVTYNF
jgi:hypothetical protein